MSGVKRVFVEKKKPFAVNAKELLEEIGGYLGIKTITDVRVLIRYDIENLSEETYKKALTTVFSEPPFGTFRTKIRKWKKIALQLGIYGEKHAR